MLQATISAKGKVSPWFATFAGIKIHWMYHVMLLLFIFILPSLHDTLAERIQTKIKKKIFEIAKINLGWFYNVCYLKVLICS